MSNWQNWLSNTWSDAARAAALAARKSKGSAFEKFMAASKDAMHKSEAADSGKYTMPELNEGMHRHAAAAHQKAARMAEKAGSPSNVEMHKGMASRHLAAASKIKAGYYPRSR